MFGEQPAVLFEAPDGVVHMTSELYSAYLCTRDLRTEEEVGFGVRDCATPEAEATPQPTPVRPSLGPRPSGPAGPLAWTPASLKEDWPAPVRPEPAGGASVITVEEEADRCILPADYPRCHELIPDPGRHRVRCPSVGRHPGAAGRWGANHHRGRVPPAVRGSHRAMVRVRRGRR